MKNFALNLVIKLHSDASPNQKNHESGHYRVYRIKYSQKDSLKNSLSLAIIPTTCRVGGFFVPRGKCGSRPRGRQVFSCRQTFAVMVHPENPAQPCHRIPGWKKFCSTWSFPVFNHCLLPVRRILCVKPLPGLQVRQMIRRYRHPAKQSTIIDIRFLPYNLFIFIINLE